MALRGVVHALVGHVMNRVDAGCVLCKERIALIVHLQHRHHWCRVVVMAVDHVGLELQCFGKFEAGAAEEDEATVVVFEAIAIPVDALAVEILVGVDEVELHVALRKHAFVNVCILRPVAQRHRQRNDPSS